MSRHALVGRFLARTRDEVAQMRASLPAEPLALDSEVLAQLARLAHKIASSAETFGFPEISVIADAVELLLQDGGKRGARERIALGIHLRDKISALDIYVEHGLAEAERQEAAQVQPAPIRLPKSSPR
jgi:HPt (histidine-containing phosphotransfer) domain-containing protein